MSNLQENDSYYLVAVETTSFLLGNLSHQLYCVEWQFIQTQNNGVRDKPPTADRFTDYQCSSAEFWNLFSSLTNINQLSPAVACDWLEQPPTATFIHFSDSNKKTGAANKFILEVAPHQSDFFQREKI